MKLIQISKWIKAGSCMLSIVLTTGFNKLPAPKLQFNEEVIYTQKLNELKTQSVNEIIFHFVNRKANTTSVKRHRFNLAAFYLKGADYEKLKDDFFVVPNHRGFQEPIPDEKDADNLGNLKLKMADLPAVDHTEYPYLILIPEAYQVDKEYVQYKMYYAKKMGDKDTEANKLARAVIPISGTLNPCPPARP